MKIFLSSDHAGFELKEEIAKYLLGVHYQAENCGPYVYIESDDYSETIFPAIEKVIDAQKKNEDSCAIIFGGSGQGEAIVANRYPNIRAGLYYGGNLDIVRLMREHNDANVLSLGARMLHLDEAKAAVDMFLATPFSNIERHARRIAKIDSKVY